MRRVIFSVIIPTRDRPEQLERCLARLAPGAQTLSPDDYEVIVSDDGAGANPIARFAKIVPGPRRGPAANRNNGARHAAGEWLVFLDDDCLPAPGWLAGFRAMIESRPLDLIEGKIVCAGPTGHPFEEQIENLHGGVFWSCNLAVRRRFFEMIGGFDEDFLEAAAEDMEFARRALRAAARQAFASEAAVEHPARRLTWGGLWRRALMLRWHSLFVLKTRERPRNILGALADRALDAARASWNQLRLCRAHNWKRPFFQAVWTLVSFPLVLPWLAFWEIRFRQGSRTGRISRGALPANNEARLS